MAAPKTKERSGPAHTAGGDGAGAARGRGRSGGGGGGGGDGGMRPNFFLAFRIDVPELLDRLGAVQSEIVESKFALELIPPSKMHVTLAVLRLDGEDAVAGASRAMDECVAQITRLAGICVRLGGIGMFGKNVLWVGLEDNEALASMRALVTALRAEMDAGGYLLERERAWSPHCTLFKASRSARARAPHVSPDAYAHVDARSLGDQPVREVLLCEMAGADDGFYRVAHRVSLE